MIDVAIIDWGTPRLAAQCAGSLNSDLFRSIEIVDAKSRDLSYAAAVNHSLARGRAPYVLALNADTRMLEPPDQIVALFEEHSDVAVIGPRQVNADGRVTFAGITGDNLQRQHRYFMHDLASVAGQCGEDLLDCPTVSGSVYFCRRSVWEKFGGFHEGCRFYFEETALDFAVRHAGWRVCYTGSTTWQHDWQQSPVAMSWRIERAQESRAEFERFCAQRGIVACG